MKRSQKFLTQVILLALLTYTINTGQDISIADSSNAKVPKTELAFLTYCFTQIQADSARIAVDSVTIWELKTQSAILSNIITLQDSVQTTLEEDLQNSTQQYYDLLDEQKAWYNSKPLWFGLGVVSTAITVYLIK